MFMNICTAWKVITVNFKRVCWTLSKTLNWIWMLYFELKVKIDDSFLYSHHFILFNTKNVFDWPVVSNAHRTLL